MLYALKSPLAVMLTCAATACCAPTNAAITIDSFQYRLSAGFPLGGVSREGTLIGNTLFDELDALPICRASISVHVDPDNVPPQYFSLSLYAVGNFNHGAEWDHTGVTATVSVKFTIDTAVLCSWSGSSGWMPSAGGGWLTGGPQHISFTTTDPGSALLEPGTYDYWGFATVGWASGQPINGYGAEWFAVPTPTTLSLMLAAGLVGTRRR